MNLHQMAAYGAPCFEAEETMSKQFFHMEPVGGTMFSVILTLNIGLE